jgi:hypothetical protein
MLLDNPAKSQYIRRNMILTTIEQPISSLINAKWLVETNGFKGRFRRYRQNRPIRYEKAP